MNDEFYIGWEPKAAPVVGRRLRKLVLILLALSLLAAIGLAISQRAIGVSVFEWGTYKTVTGTFEMSPFPHLLVPRPGHADDAEKFSTYYLVAEFKHGLSPAVAAALNGKAVIVKGTLIYRGNQTMIETRDDWIKMDGNTAATQVETIPLGTQTLRGEIVDSKCFLGVMNPGQFIPHRACAIRCISGGIPPIFLVRGQAGSLVYLLLVSAEGQPVNQQILDKVAEPLEITGEVERQGELLILRADPASYRRLSN
jgi:hypothetical protein